MGLSRGFHEDAERDALRELREEAHREAVAAAKERIKARQGRPWWVRLFPWSITITRR